MMRELTIGGALFAPVDQATGWDNLSGACKSVALCVGQGNLNEFD